MNHIDREFYTENVKSQLSMVEELLLSGNPVKGQRILRDLFAACQKHMGAGSAFDPASQDPDLVELEDVLAEV